MRHSRQVLHHFPDRPGVLPSRVVIAFLAVFWMGEPCQQPFRVGFQKRRGGEPLGDRIAGRLEAASRRAAPFEIPKRPRRQRRIQRFDRGFKFLPPLRGCPHGSGRDGRTGGGRRGRSGRNRDGGGGHVRRMIDA